MASIMNEPRMVDGTMQLGLLLESVQAQQHLMEHTLDSLKAHTRDLDAVVREEIRRTLTGELEDMAAASARAAATLRGLATSAHWRIAVWVSVVVFLCTAPMMAIMWRALPTASEVAALRSRRDELSAAVMRLERQGGRVDWRLCGESKRLCARVERSPAYGDRGDFLVLAGY